jgi:hypothetical protein
VPELSASPHDDASASSPALAGEVSASPRDDGGGVRAETTRPPQHPRPHSHATECSRVSTRTAPPPAHPTTHPISPSTTPTNNKPRPP